MSIKTMETWHNSNVRSFDHHVDQFDQVGECVYWHFLEVLPPIYVNRGFMVSEPYSYCNKYKTSTYACFIKYLGCYWYLGNISPKAVSETFERLKNIIEIGNWLEEV